MVHTFPMGATGPFGRELSNWMTLDETLNERRAFAAKIMAISAEAQGDPVKINAKRERLGLGWYDVHATRAEFL